MQMPYSVAKNVLKAIKPLKTWEDVQRVYGGVDWTQYDNKQGWSPLYNKFTGHKHVWDIQEMNVGEKTALYFDSKRRRVTTWTGKQIGNVVNLAYFQGSGFAPAERVSITFKYRGMTFRGLCSYKSAEVFTAKRIK